MSEATNYSAADRIYLTLTAYANDAREIRGLSQENICKLARVSSIELSFILSDARATGKIQIEKDERRRNIYRLNLPTDSAYVARATSFINDRIENNKAIETAEREQRARDFAASESTSKRERPAAQKSKNPVRAASREHVCKFEEPGHLGIYVTRYCNGCAASHTIQYSRPNPEEWNMQDLMFHTVFALSNIDEADTQEQLALMNLKNAMLHVNRIAELKR